MKDRVVFNTSSFTDFAGKERMVTFCAISTEEYVVNEKLFTELPEKELSEKTLHLGVSVQSPADADLEPNVALSKIIAEGKARKRISRLGSIFATSKGMINSKVVAALLEQEMEFFKQNPGVYLAGYNKDKELFLKDPEAYRAKFKK